MKLYAYRNCPYSRRVRIALAEHDVEYDYVELDPDAPHPEELVGKTPMKKGVPVLLVRDDFVLWDSTAILYWVDSAYPRSLLPSQREPQALAYAWSGFGMKLYGKMKKVLAGGDDAAAAEKAIVEALTTMDPVVGNAWLVGSEISIADVTLAPVVAILSQKAVEKLPEKVRAWAGRVRARPSVREVCESDHTEGSRPSHAA
jgi:glutathione S-transferase